MRRVQNHFVKKKITLFKTTLSGAQAEMLTTKWYANEHFRNSADSKNLEKNMWIDCL